MAKVGSNLQSLHEGRPFAMANFAIPIHLNQLPDHC